MDINRPTYINHDPLHLDVVYPHKDYQGIIMVRVEVLYLFLFEDDFWVIPHLWALFNSSLGISFITRGAISNYGGSTNDDIDMFFH